MRFGEFFRDARRRVGLTQEEAARAAGLSSGQIVSNYERDIAVPEGTETLIGLAKAYRITIDELLGWPVNASVPELDAPDITGVRAARAMARWCRVQAIKFDEQADRLEAARAASVHEAAPGAALPRPAVTEVPASDVEGAAAEADAALARDEKATGKTTGRKKGKPE